MKATRGCGAPALLVLPLALSATVSGVDAIVLGAIGTRGLIRAPLTCSRARTS
jgi:hypothetical protein